MKNFSKARRCRH